MDYAAPIVRQKNTRHSVCLIEKSKKNDKNMSFQKAWARHRKIQQPCLSPGVCPRQKHPGVWNREAGFLHGPEALGPLSSGPPRSAAEKLLLQLPTPGGRSPGVSWPEVRRGVCRRCQTYSDSVSCLHTELSGAQPGLDHGAPSSLLSAGCQCLSFQGQKPTLCHSQVPPWRELPLQARAKPSGVGSASSTPHSVGKHPPCL